MNWLKRLFGVKTDLEIMLEHARIIHDREQELMRMQMGTIDRIVAARYDRPTLAQETSPMSTYPPHPEDLSDVITDGDDGQFLARVEQIGRQA